MQNLVLNVAELGAGLLIGRLVLGFLMAAHGAQKLLGWFDGHGIVATSGFFDTMGFRPGRLFATLASVTEIASGLLVALGFLGPIGPALMLAVMIVAAVSVHWQNGLFAAANGIEVPLLYGAGAAALALTGFGAYSLDAVLGLQAHVTPALTLGVLAIGAIGGVANLFARRPQAAA